MTRRTAAPFHQLSDDAVDASRWAYELNGGHSTALEAILEHWDYGANLRLERRVQVDWERAASDLAFAGVFDLELIVEAGSGPGTTAREVVREERIRLPNGCGPQLMEIQAPSHLLSHQLVLRSSIILAEPAPSVGSLAPRAGARLWDDRHITRMESDAPRLPMEIADFSQRFGGRLQHHAPWFVNWSVAGSQRDFRSAFRLYLNSGTPEVLRRIQKQDPIVLQAMFSDVVSQVCESLLRHHHGAALEDAEEGSLADQARYWLERAFPDLATARSLLEQRPADFRAAILASVRL